jgi:hypothetical protein
MPDDLTIRYFYVWSKTYYQSIARPRRRYTTEYQIEIKRQITNLKIPTNF